MHFANKVRQFGWQHQASRLPTSREAGREPTCISDYGAIVGGLLPTLPTLFRPCMYAVSMPSAIPPGSWLSAMDDLAVSLPRLAGPLTKNVIWPGLCLALRMAVQ